MKKITFFSLLLVTMTFWQAKSQCTAASVPWSENFDQLIPGTNVFPACWGFVNTTNSWSISTTPTAQSGSNSLRRTWSTDGSVFTPLTSLIAGTSYTFSYYMRTNDAIVGYDITVAAGMGQTEVDMTEVLSTVVGYQGPTWTKFNYAFTPSQSGDYAIGIHVVAPLAPNGINFDDIKLQVTPTCIEPTVLSVSGVTAAEATLSWTESVSFPTNGYEYYVSNSNVAPNASTTVSGAVGPGVSTASILGLTAATNYYVWVRSVCSATDASDWSSVTSFTTACVAVTFFNENFDSNLIFPNCWFKVGTTGTTNIQSNTLAPSTPNVLYIYGTSATNQPVVAMPAVSNAGDGTHVLKFKAKANFTIGGILEVGYLTNSTDATSFVSLQSFTTTSTSAFNSFTANLGTDPGTNEVLAFRHSGTPANSILIDDVSWDLIPTAAPSCATNILATPNATCGNFATRLSWAATPGSDGYYLTLGTTMGGADILDAQNIGGVTSYSFSGNSNTTYYYKLVPFNLFGSAIGCTEEMFTTFTSGCYCTSLPTSNDGSGITNVQIGATDFPNGDVTYFDNSATPVALAQGINNNVQISFATGFTYDTNIWIDFNDNLTFDTSELVFSGVSLATNPTVLNASFTVPATAILGNHRMRIGAADSGQLIPNPCFSGSYGVTLDYTVSIETATCTPGAATTQLVSDCVANSFSVDVNVTNLGSGTPSITDGTTVWPVTGLGVVTVGPFVFGAPTTLILTHGIEAICNVSLGVFNFAACPPSNDACSGAIAITASSIFTPTIGSTIAANTTLGLTYVCQNSRNNDVWYTVVVPASGSLTVETQADGASLLTDTVLSVFSGTCGSLVEVGCDDDTGTGNFSLVNLTGQTPGDTLYIGVWKWGTSSDGTFGLSAYDASLANDTFDTTAFSVYPNPVKNKLHLSYNKEISNVAVYNLLGQEVLVKTTNATQTEVDMSSLTTGTYLVKVMSDNQFKTIKVSKE